MPAFHIWLQERLVKAANASPNPDRRLYISRRNAPSRRVQNEHKVETLLNSFQFETIVTENMSFQEQIRLFAQAEMIVANHGAGLTNIWFALAGAKVLDIIRRDRPGWAYVYWSLADALGHEYWYFWSEKVPSSDRTVRASDDFIPIDKLEQTLRAMCIEPKGASK